MRELTNRASQTRFTEVGVVSEIEEKERNALSCSSIHHPAMRVLPTDHPIFISNSPSTLADPSTFWMPVQKSGRARNFKMTPAMAVAVSEQ